MPDNEKQGQIPTEFNEDQTQNFLRRQENVAGEKREKTTSDFPDAAALGQVLKEMEFPADKNAILKFLEQSNRPESREVLPCVQKIQEYQNVSEVAEAAKAVM